MVEVALDALTDTAPLVVLDEALRARLAEASVVIVEPLSVILPAAPDVEAAEIEVALARVKAPSVAPCALSVILEPAVFMAAALIDVPLKTMPPFVPLPVLVTLIALGLAPLPVPCALKLPPIVMAPLLWEPTVIEPAVPPVASVVIEPVVIVGEPGLVTIIDTVPPVPLPAPLAWILGTEMLPVPAVMPTFPAAPADVVLI